MSFHPTDATMLQALQALTNVLANASSLVARLNATVKDRTVQTPMNEATLQSILEMTDPSLTDIAAAFRWLLAKHQVPLAGTPEHEQLLKCCHKLENGKDAF